MQATGNKTLPTRQCHPAAEARAKTKGGGVMVRMIDLLMLSLRSGRRQ